MQKAKQGGLLTQPIQVKIDPLSQYNKPAEQMNMKQQPSSVQYSNQFLHPINPFKPHFIADNNGHRINRAKTQPRQEGEVKKRKILPEIKVADTAQPLQRMRQKSIKLKELYQKKSKLFKKLEVINKKLIQAKLERSYNHQVSTINKNQSSFDSTSQPITDPIKPHSKSYANSRNYNYRLDPLRPAKHVSPESTTSVHKNREVISFIQKMHEESVKRDLNRYEMSQKMINNQLSHVCLECSRSKCQADALGRILKESRFL